MRKKWVAILSSALMITFFSGCGIFANLSSDVPPPLPDDERIQTIPFLTTSDILSKSSDAMKRFESYKWETNVVQDILFKNNWPRAKNTARSEVKFISTKELHSNAELTMEFNGQTERITKELYSKNGRVYIKDNNSLTWSKWDSTDPNIAPTLDNIERDFNPRDVLDTFRHETNSLQTTTDRVNYILTLSLRDDARIRPFIKTGTTNLTQDNSMTNSQTNYKSLDLSIYINKTDFIIDKLEQKLEFDLSIPGQYDATVIQEQTTEFKGELKEILLPAEVH